MYCLAAARNHCRRSDGPVIRARADAEMFKLLAAGKTPLAFSCSASKDRAGTRAALQLGVPRDAIVADYAFSDDILDYRKEIWVDRRLHRERARRYPRDEKGDRANLLEPAIGT